MSDTSSETPETPEIRLRVKDGGRGKKTVILEVADGEQPNGREVYRDRINLDDASERRRYAAAAAERIPDADEDAADAVEEMLAGLATRCDAGDQGDNGDSGSPASAVEVDCVALARPEAFYRSEVAGITVPVTLQVGRTSGTRSSGPDFTGGGMRQDLDHEEQRQAAFCGLATLGRLDLMAAVEERHGEDRLCAIQPQARYVRANLPLARCVLTNWEAITAAFGSETCRRLNGRQDSWPTLWYYLAPHADGYPAARQAALEFLESRPAGGVSAGVLKFLGRAAPRSRLLLDYCLAALHIGDDESDTIDHEALAAADLLGTHFRDDQDILDRLFTGRAGTHIYEKTIFCLCEGWADDERLDRIYQIVAERQLELRTVTWHSLICRKGTVERVAEEITRRVNSPCRPAIAGPPFVRPFGRRVQEDSGLADMLFDHLRRTPTASEKATLPQLLASAPSLSVELLAWCRDEMARQESRCELGYDWVSGRVRSVTQCLLDVVRPGVTGEPEDVGF